MIEKINRSIVLPAYLGWNRDKRLRFLERHQLNQWKSQDELRERQFEALLATLRYAYAHVPFYRQRFQSVDLHPDQIRQLGDLSRIPVLTKQDLQENLELLVSDACPPSQRYRDSSGGSTGQPTTFYGDRSCCPSKDGAMLMTDQWTGWRVGQKSAYLWGADRDASRVHSLKERVVQRFIYRRMLLNAFNMGESEMAAFAGLLRREAPALIVAYANVAYTFARFLREKGIEGIHPKGIVCSAETLTDEKRQVIEETFNCMVLNRYGSREVGLIASECECRHGLHVNTAGVFAELVPMRKDDPDAPCEIVVTDLENRVMPFIRYNTGDTSKPMKGQCVCGRGLPLIGPITGRTSDFIVHPAGKFIHGEFFSHAFYGLPGVVQFQIVQESIDALEVRIVAGPSFSPVSKEKVVRKIADVLGDQVSVNISLVDAIATPPSGKYRFAISHLRDYAP